MKNELGIEMTEKEKIKEAMYLLSDACCLLFETETDNGKSLGFLVDCAIKYAQVIYRDDDILDAACDYGKYEWQHYLKIKKNMEVIK